MPVLADLVSALALGDVEIVDLTQPLSEATPVIGLPPPLANTPGWKLHQLSHYDDRGPSWYWNWFEGGEHVGTHLDAPVHWITGRQLEDVSQIPASRLVGPAVVIDKSASADKDHDYLLTVDDVRSFEEVYGSLPEGGWLLLRTGWDARASDPKAFLNVEGGMPHTPGLDADCSRWLAQETGIVGIGVETVGIDAGGASLFEPPFPCHHFMLGAGKYGVTQLANLAHLPPTGSVVVVAPLKILRGSGSPVRVLAFVPKR
jgi:kynurenine formamidase